MTRKKVKLALITNDASRKATYKKRKKGLIKKVDELTTLCGIDACAIIYSPYEPQPEVWPNTSGAQRVVAQFKRMPEVEQSKKMLNQESSIRQRIAKATEQLQKQLRANRDKEMMEVMYQCLNGKELYYLTVPDLNELGCLVDQKLKEIDRRIGEVVSSPLASSSSSSSAITKKTNAADQINNQFSPVAGEKAVMQPVDDKGKGVVVHWEDPKPLAMDFGGMEAMPQRPHWFNDQWLNSSPLDYPQQPNLSLNQNLDQIMNQDQQQKIEFGCGDDMATMMMSSVNGHNFLWPSAFFPWNHQFQEK